MIKKKLLAVLVARPHNNLMNRFGARIKYNNKFCAIVVLRGLNNDLTTPKAHKKVGTITALQVDVTRSYLVAERSMNIDIMRPIYRSVKSHKCLTEGLWMSVNSLQFIT
jgi:hypothetical protein